MDCCETNGFTRLPEISREPPLVARRGMLKGAALFAGTAPLLATGAKKASAKGTKIELAFCSNILCAPPYEVTRAGGHFRDEGLDVQLVYMRGSTAATQALVGGAKLPAIKTGPLPSRLRGKYPQFLPNRGNDEHGEKW